MTTPVTDDPIKEFNLDQPGDPNAPEPSHEEIMEYMYEQGMPREPGPEQYKQLLAITESAGLDERWLTELMQENGAVVSLEDNFQEGYTWPLHHQLKDILAKVAIEKELQAADKAIETAKNELIRVMRGDLPQSEDDKLADEILNGVFPQEPDQVVQGEVVDEVPALVHDSGRIIDTETGDVLTVEEALETLMINMDELCRRLDISYEQLRGEKPLSPDLAMWQIEQIRVLQLRLENFATQAGTMLKGGLRLLNSLMVSWCPKLHAWGEPQLPRFKKGERKGEYKEKSLVTPGGDLIFQKTGGAVCKQPWETESWCRAQVQSWLDSLPPVPVIDGIKIEIKVSPDKRKLGVMVDNGAEIPGYVKTPVNEVGIVTVGSKRRAWSINTRVKDVVSGAVKDLRLKIAVDDDEPAKTE